MKKLEVINDFTYLTPFEILGKASTPKEFRFDSKSISEKHNAHPELFVEVNLENKRTVRFGIASNDKKTKRIAFNSRFFTNEEIQEQSSAFGLEAIQNPFHPEKLQTTLSFVHPDYKIVSPVLRENQGKYYLLIYASRRSYPAGSLSEDFYGDDIYYIHGIWEVELSEELKAELFNINYPRN